MCAHVAYILKFGECDVYVYEDVSGGWTTHVAGRRRKTKAPDSIKNMPVETTKQWVEHCFAFHDWLKNQPENDHVDLDSDFAGQSFNDPTPGECADRLEAIRASGLNVPQYAIDALRKEANTLEQD